MNIISFFEINIDAYKLLAKYLDIREQIKLQTCCKYLNKYKLILKGNKPDLDTIFIKCYPKPNKYELLFNYSLRTRKKIGPCIIFNKRIKEYTLILEENNEKFFIRSKYLSYYKTILECINEMKFDDNNPICNISGNTITPLIFDLSTNLKRNQLYNFFHELNSRVTFKYFVSRSPYYYTLFGNNNVLKLISK